MDLPSEIRIPAKHRRRHSAQFKAQPHHAYLFAIKRGNRVKILLTTAWVCGCWPDVSTRGDSSGPGPGRISHELAIHKRVILALLQLGRFHHKGGKIDARFRRK
jgi:hypothetical protein